MKVPNYAERPGTLLELTPGPVKCSKCDGATASLDMIERRRPTSADWQRWAPTIATRYKVMPARVLIQEMNADNLLVT